MRAGIVVNVTPEDRRRLEAIVADRSSPQKHVWRAKIILATADGCGTFEVMRRSGKAKPVVWRWQERFMQEGVDGLLRDKTRQARQGAAAGGDGAARHRSGARPAAGRDHALDRADAGQGGGRQPALGAAHPRGPPARPAPHPHLQAVERPEVRRQAPRHRRPLCRSARPCRRPLGRREEPDPGARPHPARPADEEGPRRHHDPRLQAQRHHDAVRRPQRARRHRHRPQHAAPSPSGVHPLPQRRRGARCRPAS